MHDPAIAAAFDFPKGDLIANRLGKLSGRQYNTLLDRATWTPIGLVLVAQCVAWVSVNTLRGGPPVFQMLASLAVFGLIGGAFWVYHRSLERLKWRVVSKISGSVEIVYAERWVLRLVTASKHILVIR